MRSTGTIARSMITAYGNNGFTFGTTGKRPVAKCATLFRMAWCFVIDFGEVLVVTFSLWFLEFRRGHAISGQFVFPAMPLNWFSFGVFLNEGAGKKSGIGVVGSYIVEGAAQVIGCVRA